MPHLPDLPNWLLSSLIYLSAAVVAVPLARFLGLGAILGYLAAGMAIGPWGLGLVTEVSEILHFAEFGVVLMLFLVGLELEPRRLWALRRPIFGWGSVQVLGCAGAMAGLGWLAGAPLTLAVVAALGLALSSTAIALQVMQERNLLRTPGGQAGFAILLFQDVAAIPILALLPLLAASSTPNVPVPLADKAFEALKIMGVIGAVVLGGRTVLRPLLRAIAKSGTPEIFTAAALLLVVGVAALMQVVGLSMALGAFLAGVLLADSEYRHELETDIEPFKGLLLGLFFMAVGMGIDFGVLMQSPWLMLGVVLGFLAVKGVVIWWLMRAMGVAVAERPVLVLLLAQGGEFAFVVFQAAAGAGAIEGEAASLLVGAVALSMLLGPLLLTALTRWVLPRLATRHTTTLEELAEPQSAPTIVVGFGRYGQIVARLLSAQGHRTTVLEHDADMVETARAFGYQVFYGDATRLDLLRTAGAATARVLVVAVDDVDQSLAVVNLARAHFAHLHVVARARDVTHWNALRERGVTDMDRELFESSLSSGQRVLRALGHTPDEAQQLAQRFKDHNTQLLEDMYPHHKDRSKLIAVAKQGRQQLEEQMAQERAALAGSAEGPESNHASAPPNKQI
ncbi:MAG: glutathione-regulated potassium-efflux system protein KefC [Polaromonas sp.]|nr:glutathione-regulated potassium-efflux system protein KefC [Polaromonas sp.]